MLNTFQQIIDEAKRGGKQRIAIAAANDADVLEAVKMAMEIGLADFTLFGDLASIRQTGKGSRAEP